MICIFHNNAIYLSISQHNSAVRHTVVGTIFFSYFFIVELDQDSHEHYNMYMYGDLSTEESYTHLFLTHVCN